MKKLLVLLLIATLAAFVFTGCDLLPSEGEGEGEGEGEVEGVTVDIDGAVTIGGKTYVSAGDHDITVTFPAPVSSVTASIGICTGDYGEKDSLVDLFSIPIALFPNEDKTVWTGSADFSNGGPCCASNIVIEAGECDWCSYTYSVIVDSEDPYAGLKVTTDACGDDPCEEPGCEVTFKISTEVCDEICCGDYCSGVGAWSIEIYDADDVHAGDCCELSLCSEPVDHTAGEGCPIEWTTKCLDNAKDYYVFITLADKVGNEVEGFYEMVFDTDCVITFTEVECDYDPATGDAEITAVTGGFEGTTPINELPLGEGCYSTTSNNG